jgi:hypothetical protein
MGKPERKRCTYIWKDNNNMDLEECDGMVWNELIWLRIGTNDGHT